MLSMIEDNLTLILICIIAVLVSAYLANSNLSLKQAEENTNSKLTASHIAAEIAKLDELGKSTSLDDFKIAVYRTQLTPEQRIALVTDEQILNHGLTAMSNVQFLKYEGQDVEKIEKIADNSVVFPLVKIDDETFNIVLYSDKIVVNNLKNITDFKTLTVGHDGTAGDFYAIVNQHTVSEKSTIERVEVMR